MKLVLMICIVFISGFIGLMIKNKYKEQTEFLIFIKSFLEFAKINISLYKNNTDEIINNYIIQHNNKNAKFIHLFQKFNNLSQFDEKIIDVYVFDKYINLQIKNYFKELGNSKREFECEKINYIEMVVNEAIAKTRDELKTKGDLYFKLSIAIGVVVDVIIW